MAEEGFLGSMFGGIGGLVATGNGLLDFIIILFIVLFAFSLIGGIIWFFYEKRKWNLKVEFKLPRSVKYLKDDIEDINDIKGVLITEWGKGFYNIKKGAVYLKRKGKRKILMKPFSVQKYLMDNFLTVVQVGAEDYVPVMPENYMLMEDDETGDRVAVLDIKTDASESKSWKINFERTAKRTFSISDALSQLLANPIFLVGLTIFLWGIQFLLLYNRIGK